MAKELYKGFIIGSLISGVLVFIVGCYLYSRWVSELSQTIPDLFSVSSDFISQAEKTPEEQVNSCPRELIYFPPICDLKGRITKKFFGDYITPENSPVQPERFSGYHTGIDLEVFTEEEGKDIQVFAFCDGNIVDKKHVTGYGGVLIQNCKIEGNIVTVLYGHLNLQSIRKEKGGELERGDLIGNLGKAFSSETDGERKHLHFGIHRGKKVDLRGYVQNRKGLKEWLNPLLFLSKYGN